MPRKLYFVLALFVVFGTYALAYLKDRPLEVCFGETLFCIRVDAPKIVSPYSQLLELQSAS